MEQEEEKHFVVVIPDVEYASRRKNTLWLWYLILVE
jgi:hypothetical protein